MRSDCWEIVLKSRKTGEYIRTQCSEYKNYKNMIKRLMRYGDLFQIETIEPSEVRMIDWNMLMAVIK
jgi:hypothetical protein